MMAIEIALSALVVISSTSQATFTFWRESPRSICSQEPAEMIVRERLKISAALSEPLVRHGRSPGYDPRPGASASARTVLVRSLRTEVGSSQHGLVVVARSVVDFLEGIVEQNATRCRARQRPCRFPLVEGDDEQDQDLRGGGNRPPDSARRRASAEAPFVRNDYVPGR